MATPVGMTRTTRIVCVSDTHNTFPGGGFKLPKGDVLIHAGDMTNQGTFSELSKTVKWIEEADFEVKIVIAGNHDITLDPHFYKEYGYWFHNQKLEDVEKCQELFKNSTSITYLNDEATTIRLTDPNGPRTTFKVFGSPYSAEFGTWAFGYHRDDAYHQWSKIPLDSDIVITHGPSKYHRDETSSRKAAGCEALRCALWRVRPRIAICGHIHDSRGAEIVQWDLDSANTNYKESGIIPWQDPGSDNKKLSIVDLTHRRSRPLANDGSRGDQIRGRNAGEEANTSPPATLGQGGSLSSGHCDLEALSGRLGRRETCVVNAAIMSKGYPHTGGKKFNKPIVIDIELPVWEENSPLDFDQFEATSP